MKDLYSIKIRSIYNETKKQDKSFIFICGYLFFEYVRPQSIYPAIDIIPWSIFFILCTIFAIIIEGRKRTTSSHPLNKLIIVYLSAVLLSSTFSYDSGASWRNIRTFLDWFLIYYLIVLTVDTEKKFFIFFLSYLLYSFKMSQHAFISWAKKGFSFSSWGVQGPPGWFENSGELGIQLCIFAPMAFYFVLALKPHLSKTKRLFFWLFPATAFIGIIGTSSRGAVIGMIAVLLYLQLQSGRFMKSLLILVMTASVLFLFLPEEQKQRFSNSGSDNTSSHRLKKWEQGLEAYADNPILGVGHEAWTSYHDDYWLTTEFGSSVLVHNIFVQCSSELGTLGLATFLLMILYSFWSNKQVRHYASIANNDFLIATSKGLDAALIGYIFSGFFVTVLYYPYFWIHIAFVSILHRIALEQANHYSEARPR